MKRYILPIVTVFSLCFALVGCRKDPLRDMTQDEARIYITNRDSTVDFRAFKTFSISDSVSVVSNNQLAGREATQTDLVYINTIKQQMQARGYSLVARDARPDLGINVTRIYNSSTGIISYPDYWGGYGGWYDPFYWGYPGYGYNWGGFYGTYQITEGALSIDILDFKDAEADKTISGVWNGLVRGSGVFAGGAAATNINALFDQSGYLRTN